MKTQLSQLAKEIADSLPNYHNETELFEYKNTILGKNGSLTTILKGLKDLSPDERNEIGKLANTLKNEINEQFDQQKQKIIAHAISQKIESEYEDVTATRPIISGGLHPITIMQKKVEETFSRMGFDIYESMELTTEYLNFDAVNIAKTHPARDMQDTFWLE